MQNYVCSELCPCPVGAENANKLLWESYDDAIFTEWKRTKASTVSEAEKTAGVTKLWWTEDETKAYGTWRDCYNKVLKPRADADTSN